MGYWFYIGEAEVSVDMEEREADMRVKEIELPESHKNSNDDHSNSIGPSYSTWADFCRQTGLLAVFYAGSHPDYPKEWIRPDGESGYGIITSHPGIVALTQNHLKEFQSAQKRYGGTPGDRSDDDYTGKRLDYLVWWTDWALNNCKYPSFYNH